MFLYSQYDLHAESLGLRSPGPVNRARLCASLGLGSPFRLYAGCKSKQQLSSRASQFRRISGLWNEMEAVHEKDLNLLLRIHRAEAMKGVLL